MVGPAEAAAATWLLNQLKSHGAERARSKLAGWVTGDSFENELRVAASRAIEASVREVLPEPTDDSVLHTTLVLDEIWPTVEVSSVSLESGWLDRLHACSRAAMEACVQPTWEDNLGSVSSWDALVRDYGVAIAPDEFAAVLTAAFVQSVRAASIRPESDLSGLAQVLSHEVAEHRDAGRFDRMMRRLDVQSAELEVTVRDAIRAELNPPDPGEAHLRRIRELVAEGVLMREAGVQLQVRVYEEQMWKT